LDLAQLYVVGSLLLKEDLKLGLHYAVVFGESIDFLDDLVAFSHLLVVVVRCGAFIGLEVLLIGLVLCLKVGELGREGVIQGLKRRYLGFEAPATRCEVAGPLHLILGEGESPFDLCTRGLFVGAVARAVLLDQEC
jgi:hypothetical protein